MSNVQPNSLFKSLTHYTVKCYIKSADRGSW